MTTTDLITATIICLMPILMQTLFILITIEIRLFLICPLTPNFRCVKLYLLWDMHQHKMQHLIELHVMGVIKLLKPQTAAIAWADP